MDEASDIEPGTPHDGSQSQSQSQSVSASSSQQEWEVRGILDEDPRSKKLLVDWMPDTVTGKEWDPTWEKRASLLPGSAELLKQWDMTKASKAENASSRTPRKSRMSTDDLPYSPSHTSSLSNQPKVLRPRRSSEVSLLTNVPSPAPQGTSRSHKKGAAPLKISPERSTSPQKAGDQTRKRRASEAQLDAHFPPNLSVPSTLHNPSSSTLDGPKATTTVPPREALFKRPRFDLSVTHRKSAPNTSPERAISKKPRQTLPDVSDVAESKALQSSSDKASGFRSSLPPASREQSDTSRLRKALSSDASLKSLDPTAVPKKNERQRVPNAFRPKPMSHSLDNNLERLRNEDISTSVEPSSSQYPPSRPPRSPNSIVSRHHDTTRNQASVPSTTRESDQRDSISHFTSSATSHNVGERIESSKDEISMFTSSAASTFTSNPRKYSVSTAAPQRVASPSQSNPSSGPLSRPVGEEAGPSLLSKSASKPPSPPSPESNVSLTSKALFPLHKFSLSPSVFHDMTSRASLRRAEEDVRSSQIEQFTPSPAKSKEKWKTRMVIDDDEFEEAFELSIQDAGSSTPEPKMKRARFATTDPSGGTLPLAKWNDRSDSRSTARSRASEREVDQDLHIESDKVDGDEFPADKAIETEPLGDPPPDLVQSQEKDDSKATGNSSREAVAGTNPDSLNPGPSQRTNTPTPERQLSATLSRLESKNTEVRSLRDSLTVAENSLNLKHRVIEQLKGEIARYNEEASTKTAEVAKVKEDLIAAKNREIDVLKSQLDDAKRMISQLQASTTVSHQQSPSARSPELQTGRAQLIRSLAERDSRLAHLESDLQHSMANLESSRAAHDGCIAKIAQLESTTAWHDEELRKERVEIQRLRAVNAEQAGKLALLEEQTQQLQALPLPQMSPPSIESPTIKNGADDGSEPANSKVHSEAHQPVDDNARLAQQVTRILWSWLEVALPNTLDVEHTTPVELATLLEVIARALAERLPDFHTPNPPGELTHLSKLRVFEALLRVASSSLKTLQSSTSASRDTLIKSLQKSVKANNAPKEAAHEQLRVAEAVKERAEATATENVAYIERLRRLNSSLQDKNSQFEQEIGQIRAVREARENALMLLDVRVSQLMNALHVALSHPETSSGTSTIPFNAEAYRIDTTALHFSAETHPIVSTAKALVADRDRLLKLADAASENVVSLQTEMGEAKALIATLTLERDDALAHLATMQIPHAGDVASASTAAFEAIRDKLGKAEKDLATQAEELEFVRERFREAQAAASESRARASHLELENQTAMSQARYAVAQARLHFGTIVADLERALESERGKVDVLVQRDRRLASRADEALQEELQQLSWQRTTWQEELIRLASVASVNVPVNEGGEVLDVASVVDEIVSLLQTLRRKPVPEFTYRADAGSASPLRGDMENLHLRSTSLPVSDRPHLLRDPSHAIASTDNADDYMVSYNGVGDNTHAWSTAPFQTLATVAPADLELHSTNISPSSILKDHLSDDEESLAPPEPSPMETQDLVYSCPYTDRTPEAQPCHREFATLEELKEHYLGAHPLARPRQA